MIEVNEELDEAEKEQIYHLEKVRGYFGKSMHGLWSAIFKPFKFVFYDAWKRKNPVQ